MQRAFVVHGVGDGDFGNGGFEFFDQFLEISEGSGGEGKAGLREGLDHRSDEKCVSAVEEEAEGAEEVEGCEKSVFGY